MRKLLFFCCGMLILGGNSLGIAGHVAFAPNASVSGSSSQVGCVLQNGTQTYTYVLNSAQESCATGSCSGGSYCPNNSITAWCSPCTLNSSNCSSGIGCNGNYCQDSISYYEGSYGNQQLYFNANGAYVVLTYDVYLTSPYTYESTISVTISYNTANSTFTAALQDSPPLGFTLQSGGSSGSSVTVSASGNPTFALIYSPAD